MSNRKGQWVRNLSAEVGGGVVSCIFVRLSTVCSHENLDRVLIFNPLLPLCDPHDSASSGAVGAPGPQAWKQTQKQTNRPGYCLESCRHDSAGLDFPRWLSGPATDTHVVNLCLLVWLREILVFWLSTHFVTFDQSKLLK